MKRKKIVTIGGGTGSFTLLSGLKKYPVDLSAIVTMADDGGSTGVLRDELGVLPPGDVRQCLVALSRSSEKMRDLMNYRFENGGLAGHNFGNILISALEKTCGGMSRGLREASRILNVYGRVLPVTEDDMRFITTLENGEVLYGEDQLDSNADLREKGIRLKSIRLEHAVRANADALSAIREANVIVLGPGDHFGSIVPNLLIEEVSTAIRNAKARIVYVANLTNKRGLTDGWSVREYVQSLERYIEEGRIDYVVYNDHKLKKELIEKYEQFEGKGAQVLFHEYVERTYKVVKANVVSNKVPEIHKNDVLTNTRSFIRHDSDKLAQVIEFLLTFNENKKIIQDII
ncbi:MAG: YvcK family protein [Candidatus Moranbacteria bacterium]|nr:YvcK family protein [Candidatus Moranbacteria bacterium]